MENSTRNPPDVSDPTEWLNTPLSSLAQVDAAVRCQVCKDLYTTPMITSCSHSFCSICIRRCLAADGKCPTCRASEQEVKLRQNWALDEVVAAFRLARDTILEFAQKPPVAAGPNTKKRKLDHQGQASLDQMDQRRKTRSQSLKESTSQDSNQSTALDNDEAQEVDGLVACPICGQRMDEMSVYSHLDRCEEERTVRKALSTNHHTASRTSRTSSSLSQRPTIQSKVERLPKLNYSIYKENALRRKLSELGIRSTGPKSLLERRHTEWVNLWNANCDSLKPRTRREVLQELDMWERSQGSLAPSSAATSSILKKDFDGAAWATNHADDFQRLVANARHRKTTPEVSKQVKADGSEAEMVSPPRTTGAANVGYPSRLSPDIPSSEPKSNPNLTVAVDHENAGTCSKPAGLSLANGENFSGTSGDHEVVAETPNNERNQGIDPKTYPPAEPSTPTRPELHAQQPEKTPSTSRFFSPAKPRMFEDVDDPVVDSEALIPVG